MSSVPVQFLVYVKPQPVCSLKPVILPLSLCLEVQVGVSVSFNLSAMNLCDPAVASLTDIIASTEINGMDSGVLTTSITNASIEYMEFNWIPQANQLGPQQLCTVAYTR